MERIRAIARRLRGVQKEQGDRWQAGRGVSRDAAEIWFRPNYPAHEDGRLHLGDRQWEVLGELTRQTGRRLSEPDFGSSVAERHDILFELVAKEADRARVNSPDAPGHRIPNERRQFVDPGNLGEWAFCRRVNNVWRQDNFGEVVNAL